MQRSHTSLGTRLAEVARACGIARSDEIRSIDEVDALARRIAACEGPAFAQVFIASEELPRRAAAARRRLPQDPLPAGAGARADLRGPALPWTRPGLRAQDRPPIPAPTPGTMSQAPYHDPGSARLYFWVSVDGVPVSASIEQGHAALPVPPDQRNRRSAVDLHVERHRDRRGRAQAAGGGRASRVMLRDPDLSAPR
jgi:hypothetical protein